MRFLQFVPGTATPAKPGKLRTTLVGAALACAVMAAGAGPVSAAVPAEPETRAPEAATAAEPAAATAVATQTAAPAAIPVTLAPGLSGFDNIGADTSAQLSCLSDSGYSFDVIDALGAGWDSEYRSAAALGISVVLFQGFYKPYWTDPTKGTSRGQLMVSNAQLVGYPGGAQVFLNLEDNLSDGASPTTRAGIIQWVQNWAAVVKAAGYTPGVYVGNPQILSADDLTSALTNVSVFWRSASGSAPQSARGYVLRQPSISAAACGTTIDIDTSGSDNLGAGLVGAGFPRGLTGPATAGALGPLTPARILDTRGGGAPGANGTTSVQILGAGGVPTTGVSAVAINVTAVNPTAGGYLTVWPSNRDQPYASNLNFAAGQTVPNLVVVPVGTDGKIKIFNGSSGAVDLLVDVAGYYLDGNPTAAGTLGPLIPARILDTRGGGALGGGTARALKVTGRGGVPASGVSAVMVNVTAVSPMADGFVTAWPSGTNLPTASNVNFVHSRDVANLAIVPVGADGKLMLFNGSTSPVDLLADVVGYIAD